MPRTVNQTQPYKSLSNPNLHTGVVSVTGSKVVNLGVSRKMKYSLQVGFEDAGGADAEGGQRVSAKRNTDGTFTIYVEEVNPAGTAGTAWAASDNAINVRFHAYMESAAGL